MLAGLAVFIKKTRPKLGFTLVRERDTFWNPFLKSVLNIDAKLVKLGFIYLDGQVAIIDLDGEVTRV